MVCLWLYFSNPGEVLEESTTFSIATAKELINIEDKVQKDEKEERAGSYCQEVICLALTNQKRETAHFCHICRIYRYVNVQN